LHDDVHVLPRRRVHGDLGRVPHRLLPGRSQELDDDAVRADLEPQDRDEEHARMLRRQAAHADVAEDAHEADLAVLPHERVVAQRRELDLFAHFTTTFTRRSGTTMTFAGEPPPSAACHLRARSASRSSSASGVPAGISMRSRILPETWITIVTFFAAAS